MSKTESYHQPVMTQEVLTWLGLPAPLQVNGFSAKRVIDATLGFGGHTQALLAAGCEVLGIDMDTETLKLAQESIASAKLGGKFKSESGNFTNIDEIAKKAGFDQVDGILFDLGINSFQLDQSGRGLSFKAQNEDLDMRLNKNMSVKASDLITALDKSNLTRLFGEVLAKGLANQLALAIIERKRFGGITKVGDLVAVCDQTFGHWSQKLLPKIFLALRLAVNGEMENINEALPKAFGLLREGGRLLVISFHSTEDRVVKRVFAQLVENKKAINLTGVGIIPATSEIEVNPRSRSARLRIIEKI